MLLAACALIALVAAVPLVFVIGYVISTGWTEAWRLLVRPRVGELLVNTTRLVVGGMLLSAVLGTATAWLVERTNLPGRRVWHLILAAPLAVPAFVISFGWVSLTSTVEGFGGALLIVTLAYYPLVYLPVGATLRGLDPALEETARSLGHGPWRTFIRVVLPQLRPAVLGGSLLVGYTCWPSSVPCRCCGSRPSPPPSTISTVPRSTVRRPTCWPASSSFIAPCCSRPSWAYAGIATTPGPDRGPPAPRHPYDSAG